MPALMPLARLSRAKFIITKTVLPLALWSLLLAGCSGDDTEAGPGADNGGGATTCVDPAQPVSAECCLDHGIDACGASLTCALLDGRSLAVCYANSSRLPGETCTHDGLCVSGLCGANTGTCAQLLGLPCSPGDPCADPSGTFPFASCTSQDGAAHTCEGGDSFGVPCGLCDVNEDCPESFSCSNGRCLGDVGTITPNGEEICCLSGESAAYSQTEQICR